MPHRPERIGNYPILKPDTPQVTFASCVGDAGTEPGRGVTVFSSLITGASGQGAATLVLGSQDAVSVPANRYNYFGVVIDSPAGHEIAHDFLLAYNFEFSADFNQHNILFGGLFIGRYTGSSPPSSPGASSPMADSIYLLPSQVSFVNATGDHCNASATGAVVMRYPGATDFRQSPVLGWFIHNASVGVISVDDMTASLSWNAYKEDVDIFDPNR